MSVAETDKTGKLSDFLGSLLSFTAEGTYWLLTFPEEATGKGSVSPTMLYGAAVSVRSRLRREKERGRVSSEATTSHGLYK